MLSCTNYGSDYKSHIRILNSVLFPTIYYASLIYSSSSKSQLKLLNSIQNTGITLAIGTFKTSPETSLNIVLQRSPLLWIAILYINVYRVTYILKNT